MSFIYLPDVSYNFVLDTEFRLSTICLLIISTYFSKPCLFISFEHLFTFILYFESFLFIVDIESYAFYMCCQ